MAALLTSAELDALRSNPSRARKTTEQAVPYNFRRPDRITKEQLHALHFLHDRCARNMSTSFSAYLRTTMTLSVASVDQLSYDEFLRTVADPTAFYALGIAPFDELGALEVNPGIAFALIDRLLGGAGHPAPVTRALTEIEQNVVDSIVKLLLEGLAEAWKPVTNLAFSNGVTLTMTKLGAVPVLTRELQVAAKAGFPAALIDALESDITVATDRAFLDPANVAVPTVNPGSITAPTTPIASTGNYTTDVQTLLTAFYTGRPSAQSAVVVTNLAHANTIATMNSGGGIGVPVLVSEGALGNTIVLDPGGVFLADAGIEIDASTETSLQMNSTPDNPATSTTVMVSTWQTNTIAYRVRRAVNWLAQSGAVKYLAP